jgi:quinoprotein glucose dehydrogenase
MEAPQTGSPMTYLWQGRQYVVVAIGGGSITGEYVAFALPDRSAAPPTTAGQP